MSKLEIVLIAVIFCVIVAYLYVNFTSQPNYDVFEFKSGNSTILEERGSDIIGNDASVDTDLNSTIKEDNSNG